MESMESEEETNEYHNANLFKSRGNKLFDQKS